MNKSFLLSLLLFFAFSLLNASSSSSNLFSGVHSGKYYAVCDYIFGQFPQYSAETFGKIHLELEQKGILSTDETLLLALAYIKTDQYQRAEETLQQKLDLTNNVAEKSDLVVWKSKAQFYQKNYVGALSSLDSLIHSQEDTGFSHIAFEKALMSYLVEYSKKAGEPVFAHFNGGFGNYLAEKLSWSDNVKTHIRQNKEAIKWLLKKIELETSQSILYLELLADLCLHMNADEYRYVAAMAYYRASSLAQSNGAEAFVKKSIFAMEHIVRYADRFNKVRYHALKIILEDFAKHEESTQAKMSSLEKEWQNPFSVDKVVFPPTFTADLFSSPVGANLNLWPVKDPVGLQRFANEQIMFEKNRNLGVNPNETVVNPNLDVKEIKRNKLFNFYALIVISILVIAFIVIWKKVQTASRLYEKEQKKL